MYQPFYYAYLYRLERATSEHIAIQTSKIAQKNMTKIVVQENKQFLTL